MCGIFCEVCDKLENSSFITDSKIMNLIRNRGPDHVQKITRNIGNNSKAVFCGSVLWMQGATLTGQPMEDICGILLYNGDIFDETWDKTISDTQIIMEKLKYCKNQINILERHQNIIGTLKKLKGPFALVYYDKLCSKLYFTRDRIGRNSLLIHKNKSVVISSVLGRNYKAYEIPATHIYMLDVHTMSLVSHCWSEGVEETCNLTTWLEKLEQVQSLSDEQFHFNFIEENIVDNNNIVSYMDTIATTNSCKKEVMRKLLQNDIINNIIKKISELLEKSVKLRLDTQPQKCKQCISLETSCSHCTVGILFSGGLDCTILAYLADKYLCKKQPIDLINVAFNRSENGTNYDVPDRLTGESSFEELKRICPNRCWEFRKVDVPITELEKEQKDSIADLVYPRQTILDESLGSALWFASRGKYGEDSSSCRVLILGSGADELFGGYTRHRNSYKRHGWNGLQKELTLDWKRISYRNLSRDNRVVCDHGRQPRMPYLDEDFTDYVISLQPWFRCYPSENLGPGLGDKLILRLVAFNYGLEEVATLPKRALQFGSRIANKKDKGSDVSKNFLS